MFVLSLLGALAFLCELRRGIRRNSFLFHQCRIKQPSSPRSLNRRHVYSCPAKTIEYGIYERLTSPGQPLLNLTQHGGIFTNALNNEKCTHFSAVHYHFQGILDSCSRILADSISVAELELPSFPYNLG